MLIRAILVFSFLNAASALAASSGFLLGMDYSEWLTPNAGQMATDRFGALYILSANPASTTPGSFASPFTLVTKLSADGKTILWQNNPGFAVNIFEANTMAVDPNGGVYLLPASTAGDTSVFVAKIGDGGGGVAWKTAAGPILPKYSPVLAADSQGRTYVAGSCGATNQATCVVRLNAAGSGIDYTAHVKGAVTSIAVDGKGAAFVAGYVDSPGGGTVSFLARIEPDGSAGFYSTLIPMAPATDGVTVAVGGSGDVAVLQASAVSGSVGVLQRFDSTGAVTSSKNIPDALPSLHPDLWLDGAGNAYVTGVSFHLYPVKNSLATCGSDWLTVIAPDGAILQTTYIPGGRNVHLAVPVTLGQNSTVFAVGFGDASFIPTQNGPFPPGPAGTNFLLRLSPNANAQTVPLACVGNAGSYAITPIAPGEIVTLFGGGLGPVQGIQTQATALNPFPTQAAGVVVTFDGKPAPLLWVQDAQINAVAPWSLTAGQNTEVCVSYNHFQTNCLNWPVLQVAPGVFTVDGVHAAALNQDQTVNSANNPAAPGSIVSVFATGLGPVTPVPADGSLVGLPLPTSALAVRVQSSSVGLSGPMTTPFEVMYAGPAPYLVAGASQINFKIDTTAGFGESQISVTAATGQSAAFQVYVTSH